MSNKSDFWAVTQPAHVVHFIQLHVASARFVAARTGIPAEVILAQSALESDWGRVVRGNDYFGIKRRLQARNAASSANGKISAYSGYDEAVDDYVSLLQREYTTAFAHKANPEEFADAVARQGYSTDPQYASKLRSIILLNVLPVLSGASGG
jgi:flagellum-specific peptidoglycan hydrolase FlgJ